MIPIQFHTTQKHLAIIHRKLSLCVEEEEDKETSKSSMEKMATKKKPFSSSEFSSFSIDVLFAAVFAIARAERRSSSSSPRQMSSSSSSSPQGFARLFVHATVLASGWRVVARGSSSFVETTYRFDPKGGLREEDALDDDEEEEEEDGKRNVLTVRSLDVGRKSVNFTFSFEHREEEERRMDKNETEKKYSDEEEDDVKTLLVSCPADDEAWKSSSATAARTFGEDVVKLMVKEKIVEFGEAKEKECAKCKEWERRERERERENRIEGGYPNREDPFRRGQPLFPGQPLRPGMGPRIDHIGPPDMPDFGRDF